MKKDKGAIAIIISMDKKPKDKKTKMAYGGMSGGKKHMYVAGGSVQDNPGLLALKKKSPETYTKITGKNA